MTPNIHILMKDYEVAHFIDYYYENIRTEVIKDDYILVYYDDILIRKWIWATDFIQTYFESRNLILLDKNELEEMFVVTGKTRMNNVYVYAPYIPRVLIDKLDKITGEKL